MCCYEAVSVNSANLSNFILLFLFYLFYVLSFNFKKSISKPFSELD
jgi:hypothetical protein